MSYKIWRIQSIANNFVLNSYFTHGWKYFSYQPLEAAKQFFLFPILLENINYKGMFLWIHSERRWRKRSNGEKWPFYPFFFLKIPMKIRKYSKISGHNWRIVVCINSGKKIMSKVVKRNSLNFNESFETSGNLTHLDLESIERSFSNFSNWLWRTRKLCCSLVNLKCQVTDLLTLPEKGQRND